MSPTFKSQGVVTEKGNETKTQPVIQRAREPGKCWRCGDVWFHGHKCKQAPVINMLTGEEPTDQSSEQEEVIETEQPEQTQNEENCMHISLQAMSASTVSTLSVLINIGGKQAVALVDSGSNSTFMSLKFALTTSYSIIKDQSRTVTVAGGGILWSSSHVPETTFHMGKEEFTHSFRVLDLPGYDIVIGCDLLAQHSPVSFDYENKQIILMKNKTQQITIPACNSFAAATEIPGSELAAMLSAGTTGYAIFLIRDVTVRKPATHVTPPKVEQVLEQYSEVFAEPEGLPPVRSRDHKITLKPDAALPNIKQYIIPHKHRDEVEKQV